MANRGSSGGSVANGRDNPFLTRLRLFGKLSEEELAAVTGLLGEARQFRARTEIAHEGGSTDHLHVLLAGWACRSALLSDGRRQITALLLPGDVCDLDGLYLRRSDAAVGTLTACSVATVERAALRALAARSSGIGAALGWLGAVENAMLAERNTCLGRRSAREHVAHLLCELLVRLTLVGQARGVSFELPITQEEIADTIGLTSVHVNRTLQSLRTDGLIQQHGSTLTIPDPAALQREASFRSNYLHIEDLSLDTTDFGGRLFKRAGFPDPHGLGHA